MIVRERARHKPSKGFRPEWYRMREGKHVTSDHPRITVSFDRPGFNELAALASARDRPVSAVIREAVAFYMENRPRVS